MKIRALWDSFPSTVRIWLKAGAATFISGGAASVVASGVQSMAHSAGVDVAAPNFESFAIVFVSSGLFSLFTYLAKSPLPGVTTGEEPQTTKP